MSRLDRKCSVSNCETAVWAREMCRKHYYRWSQHGDPSVALLMMPPPGAPLRFIERLASEGEGCVLWPFAKNNHGYAQINLGGVKRLVTRIVCERRHGPAPTQKHQAAHSCGMVHLSCVAPWHLSWKTAAGNVADAQAHGTFSRGDHHATKLSSEAVRVIRDLKGTASQEAIGRRFGVSQSMVSHIHRGKAWVSA